jgi:hypothetical protein
MRLGTPESCGNADGVETLEIQKAGFPRFPQRLGNLAKAPRFPHFHSSYGLLWRLNQTTPAEELGAVEKWKSKSRIPTFPPHRWPAAQGRNSKKCIRCARYDVYTMRRS